ncbi:MAG: hypothetical protein FWC32_12645 [Firmicutes bacterium]|nr:hypothetical protein [Bacillota bacterium]
MKNLKFDDALSSYFTKRENVPAATKEALRTKLCAAAKPTDSKIESTEKPFWLWLLAPCVIFTAIFLLFAINMFFGTAAVIFAGLVYYFTAAVGGAIIIIASLNKRTSHGEESFV